MNKFATDLEAWGDLDTKVVIARVVDLLKKGPGEIKEYLAAILKSFCFGNLDDQLQVAIGPLSVLVKGGTDIQKNEASTVLSNLAQNSLNYEVLATNGAVESLVGMLSSWSNVQIDNALSAVEKFVSIPGDQLDITRYLANIHAVKSLKKLILDGSKHQKTKAVSLLEDLLAKRKQTFYKEIWINVPGTFQALVDLQTTERTRNRRLHPEWSLCSGTISLEK